MRAFVIAAILALMIPMAGSAFAQTNVTMDSVAMANGYMNVFDLGGGFQFGSPWGIPDLVASWSGNIATLSPNTIGDPDPYWYIGGGGPGAPGNKLMEANMYAQVDDGSLAGQNIMFSGAVLASSLTSAHNAFAFIRDFAPDFSSVVETKIPLSAVGPFSLSQVMINDPARHVRWGVQLYGVNVWVTDTAPFGTIDIGADGTVATDESSFSQIKSLY